MRKWEFPKDGGILVGFPKRGHLLFCCHLVPYRQNERRKKRRMEKALRRSGPSDEHLLDLKAVEILDYSGTESNCVFFILGCPSIVSHTALLSSLQNAGTAHQEDPYVLRLTVTWVQLCAQK